MSATKTEERMTAAEFLKKYGHCSGVELVRGRVVWAGQEDRVPNGRPSMPEFRHGVVAWRVARLIGEVVDAGRLGWVAINDTFVLTDPETGTVRGADVLFVSYARVPPGATPETLDVAPELVVEVRSPSDRLNRLAAKATEYLQAGVTVVLIVDPDTESVAVFRQEELPQRFSNGDELTFPDVLPGFAVPVRAFFG